MALASIKMLLVSLNGMCLTSTLYEGLVQRVRVKRRAFTRLILLP